jgi:hypothetical protein
MHPSEHRLRQLDAAYLRSLDLEALRNRSALAEVIETCRQRGQDPWRTVERAIADRRAGRLCPPWPR